MIDQGAVLHRGAIARGLVGALLLGAARLWAAPLSVDLTSREESRQFYRAVWGASENVPSGFTGDVGAGRAGDTSAAFKEAVRLRVNFFRAFAGIPGEVQFSPVLNAKCQLAALMGSWNNSVTHTPSSSARGYTADGAEAAGKSNIGLLGHGPQSIMSYMRDAAANNRDVGHRRWILYPQTKTMGTGDVPASLEFSASNALWILDESTYSAPRPATRTPFIAWPPAGFVPYGLVYPRWSLSAPGANFSQAFVSVRRNGASVPVAVTSVNDGYGENTIVWSIDNQDPSGYAVHSRPTADVSYAVEVLNVMVGGTSQTFRYTVTVYDPAAPDGSGLPQKLNGPTTLAVGQSGFYSVTAPAFLGRLQWRSIALTPATPRFDAEGSAELNGLVASTSGYKPVVSDIRGNGAAGYRLIHSPPVTPEHTLMLRDAYFVSDASASLKFLSRLGYATARQAARVQVSTDDGVSWSDVYSQTGDGTAGETTFHARSVSLAPFVNRTIHVRFNYSFEPGSIFNQSDPGVGWYFDDISLDRVSRATASAVANLTGSTFSFTRSDGGEIGLQARGSIDAYPSEWTNVLVLGPTEGGSGGAGNRDPAVALPELSTGTARLVNLSVLTTAGRDSAALAVGFTVAGVGEKPVLIRAVGPTLGLFGLGGALTDPMLVVRNGAGATVLENDNWGGAAAVATAASRLGAFGLDAGSRDAAALPILTPGSYTVTASPANTATAPGAALVELYDADPGGTSRLVNISARVQVAAGSDALTVGFAVGGAGTRNVLIRAVGPTLAQFGVGGALADPKMEIRRDGVLLRTSDNWNASLAPLFGAVGAFPLAANSADAAMALALGPGTYSVQISGVDNTAGATLVEVYELP